MRGTWELLRLMQTVNVEPDVLTFDYLICRVVKSNNLELALQFLAMMSSQGIVPMVKTTSAMVAAACAVSQPQLALDLAHSFEQASPRRLGGEVWMDCLAASAERSFVSYYFY